jgi:hypothetical protein
MIMPDRFLRKDGNENRNALFWDNFRGKSRNSGNIKITGRWLI